MRSDLYALFEAETVVMAREFPGLRGQLQRARATGDVVAVLPGTHVLAEVADRFDVRALAVCRRFPDAILVGESAARLTYAMARPTPRLVHVSTRGRQPTGFRFDRRTIPEEFVGTAAGLRFTLPAWTALDLASAIGPGALDEALRLGVKLDHLSTALAAQSPRRGTALLRQWLRESSEQPWSPAERAGHEALRAGLVTGWRGNLAVSTSTRTAYLDIGFAHLGLGIEIDGYEFHCSQKAFALDRLRDSELAAKGWHIVRIPAALVLDAPDRFVQLVRQIVAQRERLLTAAGINWTSDR